MFAYSFRVSLVSTVVFVCIANPEPLRIDGLISAVFTPYTKDGGINVDVVDSIAAYQKSMGVKGVFVGGTTGDSLSLTLSERKKLTEAWATAAQTHNLKMIVHVGAEALGDALEFARHAQEKGAVAIGAMPSVFFKPATTEAAAMWLKRIGEEAPTLPLYYYHIPSMTGVSFKMLDLIQSVEKVGVPQFVGVKYTGLYETQAWMDFEACRAYKGGSYEVLCGREDMTVQALAVGTQGFIGSQMNHISDVYREIAHVWPNMTRALEIQALAHDFITMWEAVPPGVDGNRLALEYRLPQIGHARLPKISPDAETVKTMHQNIKLWCVKAEATLAKLPALCKQAPGDHITV